MRLPILVRLLRTCAKMNGELVASFFARLCDQRSISDARGSEHALVALNFRRRTERLRIVVGKLDRGSSFDVGNFSDQADGIKIVAAAGIASAKIIGEQRAPAGAESNLTIRNPLALIEKIGRVEEISLGCACLQGAAEIRMEAEYFVDVEGVRGDDEFFPGVAASRFQPFDIFVSGHV